MELSSVLAPSPTLPLESFLTNPSLLSCRFNGQRFFYTRDLVPHQNEKELLGIFKEALLNSQEFSGQYNEKAQFFHQRKAQKTVIFTTHQLWKGELEGQFNKFLEAINLSRNLYKYIPLMSDPANIAEALSLIISLNVLTLPLQEDYEELIELLHSEQYAAALEIYKDFKKQCKVLMGKKTIEERVDEISRIIKQLDRDISIALPKLNDKEGIVSEKALLIFTELVYITKLTAQIIQGKPLPEENENSESWWSFSWLWPFRFFKSSVAEESVRNFADLSDEDRKTLTERIDNLMGVLKATERKIFLKYPQEDEKEPAEENKDLALKYVDKANPKNFPPEDDFRNGKPFATAPMVGPFREIRPQVNKLRKIAMALVELQKTIRQLMSHLNEGILEDNDIQLLFKELEPLKIGSLEDVKKICCSIIEGIEMLIAEQAKLILEQSSIHSIPEGLYYVANLFAKAREVKKYLDLLGSMIDDHYIHYPKTAKALRGYLDSIKPGKSHQNDYQGNEATMGLYLAAVLACQLQKPTENRTINQKLSAIVFPQIHEILAKVGPRTLTFSLEEKTVLSGILSKWSLKDFQKEETSLLPQVMIITLTKALLKQTLFSKSGNDPKLDVVLCLLENEQVYAETFQRTLEELPWFKSLLEHYLLQSDAKTFSKECLLMAKALSLFTPKQNSIENLFCYAQVKQILQEIQGKSMSEHHQKRVGWINKKANSFFAELDLPKVDSQFFELLCISLYANDPKEKEEGTVQLLKNLRKLKPEDLSKDLLLYGWVLEYSRIERIERIPHGKFILTQFFKHYLGHPEDQLLWRNLYGTGFLEIALKKLAQSEEGIVDFVKEHRTLEGYDEWFQIVDRYEQFLKISSELVGVSNDPEKITTLRNKACQFLSESERIISNKHDADYDGLIIIYNTESPSVNPQTHLAIAHWCCEEMKKELSRLIFD